ncbi:MAG: T9SS type A sorting domain-containing protein [Bacteroidia bacterium]|nr:T9SS type A sorting domain-containing protein [Bacteroidia bacterium]
MKLNNSLCSFFVCCLFSVTVKAQWNTNPGLNTPVATLLALDQENLSIISDTKNGAIISWSDHRNGNLADVYVQRLNWWGNPLWTSNGVPVCVWPSDESGIAMVEDGKGGVILVWNDERTGPSDIYAQRVDSNGAVLWTANGVSVCSKANIQKGPKLLADGNGGAIIVWEDSVGLGYDIYAQQLNSSGVKQWAAGGVAICTAVGAQINPKIQTDNGTGAIICWQDKRNGSDYDIMAQKINASGVVQWATNGVFVASLTGSQINPKMRADGSGGVFIGWQDKRNGSDYDVYIQRLNSAGVGQWINNGTGVCVGAGSQSAIDMNTTPTPGEIIVGWKDDRNGNYDIYAQKLNSTGVVQWTSNGVAATTSISDQINPNLVSDGSGGTIIVWQDSTMGTSDVYSQRINSAGANQWTANGVQVGVALNDQTTPKNIPDGTGGSIYAFEDRRSGTGKDVYAHRLDANGSAVGINEESKNTLNVSCFPNPFTNSTTIKFKNPSSEFTDLISLKVFDLAGKEIAVSYTRLQDGFVLNRSSLQSGTYFFSLVADKMVMGTGKILILD